MSTPTANRRVYMDSTMPDKAATTPSKSAARRALGELTPNAKVSPQKPTITSDKTQPPRNLSPLKQARAVSLVQDENAYGISKLPNQMTGRKRSIDEVDGAVAREDAVGSPMKRVDGRDTAQKHFQSPILNIEESARLASQIVDLSHEDLTPTDEDTPEPAPRGTQETTGTRASFSSLIDYNPRSQQTSSSPPLRATKTSTRTHAEILRLRLRVALYKVRTDQTFVPLSCLEIPEKYQRKPAKEDASAEAGSPVASPERERTAPTITVTEDGPSDKGSEGSAPKLLPAPVLLPTAYSTRFITEASMPSSPPHSVAVDSSSTPRARGPQEFVTPVASRQAAAQLSSPPYSEDYGRHRSHNDSDNLTSSVVKGRAAEGLMKLTRSV
ncbi:hypothetical protein GTA08_BOTSDO03416 [Neofusicoccum parvum]|uniref:Uncharacterized protein n=1 Tax=Neofusicoccum parvum TaxID=310453 RepID=A0ACB5RXF6_9PEZI|nr:hypothetical protein GTA08_BOTSDO03416 [Neofusicoccum parvum]GME53989.1 hypothetical protein GTA08_BOTSDO03416 [Neofusicoccum parvum]